MRLGDDVSAFECRYPELDDWLRLRARAAEGRSARTYVVAASDRVVGYYCLAAGSIGREELPTAKLRRNQPSDVPVIVLGRLAVDLAFERHGVGSGLLKDAFRRCLTAADTIGVRAIVVHAIDEGAAQFYEKLKFKPLNAGPLTLFVPLETAAAAAVDIRS
ncbi:MAG TPA: GNAT family N-acetyltransferase [Stellaceae bacterium]|nr:GNAT family N-acetyltransferase [Stellaceae bacterium]